MTLPMSEAQFQRRITDLADLLGLRWYHPNQPTRDRAGWPDLAVVGPGGFVLAEVKTDRGRLRPEQESWLDDLARAGVDAQCWRPVHWPHIETTLKRLARR